MRKKLAIVASVFIACTITINVISNNEKIEFQDENNLVVRKKKNLLSYLVFKNILFISLLTITFSGLKLFLLFKSFSFSNVKMVEN